MELSLASIHPGQQMTVARVDCIPQLQHRLRALGLVPGTRICCRYRSPAGDLVALELRGTVLAMRVRDLRTIRVRLNT